VVGVPDAVRRFPPGSTVLVDGSTGEVTLLAEPPAPETAAPETAAPEMIDLSDLDVRGAA